MAFYDGELNQCCPGEFDYSQTVNLNVIVGKGCLYNI